MRLLTEGASLIAFTFTEKAAGELKERIRSICPDCDFRRFCRYAPVEARVARGARGVSLLEPAGEMERGDQGVFLARVRRAFPENFFQGREKWWKIVDNRLPNDLHVDVEIGMDEAVAHAG